MQAGFGVFISRRCIGVCVRVLLSKDAVSPAVIGQGGKKVSAARRAEVRVVQFDNRIRRGVIAGNSLGIDHGGADNYLLGNEITGSGITPYNNINCRIEKYDGPALEDDCYTDKRIIEL